MEKMLSDIKVGKQAKITNVHGDIHIRRRLYELGFVEGEIVKILSASPLKNSFLVSIRGYCLAMRKIILSNIMVNEL